MYYIILYLDDGFTKREWGAQERERFVVCRSEYAKGHC